MSTQFSEKLDVYYDHEQEELRLLELPPELLDQLTSHNTPRFAFKSAEASESQNGSSYWPHAVLCTPTQTFSLRQVQSSNELIVLAPSAAGSIQAFAKCNGTLELSAVESLKGSESAKKCLLESLATYKAEPDLAYNHVNFGREARSKEAIFAAIPFSYGEIEQAWSELCAFELEGRCFRPTPLVLKELWSAICEGAILHGLDITGAFTLNELHNAMRDCILPKNLHESFIKSVSRGRSTSIQETASLDPERVVKRIGQFLVDLESNSKSDDHINDFLGQWKAELPDGWKSGVSKEALNSLENHERTLSRALSSSISPPASNPQDNKRKPVTRNWHEKFKKARR